jgi:hypothetical protein
MSVVYRMRRCIAGIDPAIAATELERLSKKNGGLTPPDVVGAARPKDAPLHSAFEWDNGLAAEQFRLVQARTLIRAVQVVYEDSDGTERTAPVFAHVISSGDDEEDDVCRYYPVTEIVASPSMFDAALDGLRRHLNACSRAVDELLEAARRAGPKERRAAAKIAPIREHLRHAAAHVAAVK